MLNFLSLLTQSLHRSEKEGGQQISCCTILPQKQHHDPYPPIWTDALPFYMHSYHSGAGPKVRSSRLSTIPDHPLLNHIQLVCVWLLLRNYKHWMDFPGKSFFHMHAHGTRVPRRCQHKQVQLFKKCSLIWTDHFSLVERWRKYKANASYVNSGKLH